VYSKALLPLLLGNLELYAYSNTFFANAKDCKLTLGYLFKLISSTICYCSSKQKLITTSTTKAKYVSLTYAAKEAT
jgi:hypothetical protein